MSTAPGAPTAGAARWRPPAWTTGIHGDVLLYAGCAVMATGLAIGTQYHGHRLWGLLAAAGYAAGAVASAIMARSAAGTSRTAGVTDRVRLRLAGAVLVLAGLAPLLTLIIQRVYGVAWSAQPEVPVVERSGRLLLETGSPYPDIDGLGRAATFEDYTPYLPGMAGFGLPRAVVGERPSSGLANGLVNGLTDARVAFAVTSAALLFLAVRVVRRHWWPDVPVRAVQLVAVVPATTLTMATGGDDLPVLALLLLALACCHAGRATLAGLATGVALAMKLTAAPVLLVAGVAVAVTLGRPAAVRFLLAALGSAAAIVLPFVLTAPDALVEHVIRFPAGLTDVRSPAASPLPGYLIAQTGSGGRAVAIGLLVTAAVAVTVLVLVRPPSSAAQAAGLAAFGLLLAMLLMPATRYGYLLYPLALTGAAIALRGAGHRAGRPADRAAGSG